jgi:2-oxoglutarate dehydrogenase E1 component
MDPEFLGAMHDRWKEDPTGVDESWQLFFQGFDLASCPRACVASDRANDQSNVASLIYNYRDQGHRLAHVNPLKNPPESLADLRLDRFGLSQGDLDRVFDTGRMFGPQTATLKDILQTLRTIYCGSIGVEYLHIQDVAMRRWIQKQVEENFNKPQLSQQEKKNILHQLIDAETFETFVHRRYLGQKRFSIEGGETLIPILIQIIESAALGDPPVEEIVLGMAHRGRLNVLVNVLNMSFGDIFSEFEDNFIPGSVAGDGDVKYHIGYASMYRAKNQQRIRVSLTANPSHLEASGPVVLGRARAKQHLRELGDAHHHSRVLPLLVHGDAAFAGQGMVAESLNLARLKGYRVGGTVHIIVNNQIGFTTLPGDSRSSEYVTDVAKMIGAPVFHVNGDDPEACVHVARMALGFRQRFERDVIVDMLCFRRHGHSEGDEPAFTQPVLYKDIREHATVRQIYARKLEDEGVLTNAQAKEVGVVFNQHLDQAQREVKKKSHKSPLHGFLGLWQGFGDAYRFREVETGVVHAVLVTVARGLTTLPEGFRLHPKLARTLPGRLAAVEKKQKVDWGLGESLAFGSLLLEGHSIRLSGQDSQRGTFSHRHSVWRNMNDETAYIPLDNLDPRRARFRVFNSPLSEASVLGFEYGYSLVDPQHLVLWEAQFGDFANGAQVIIDQFLVAARSKWIRASALVLLLPHGYEGQGPEHSNAYMERYLMACAENNLQVCVPTTPAQLFHVLRRQIKQPYRLPLILFTPKSLLRLPDARSKVEELETGSFQALLDDPTPPKDCRRLIVCCGKVYYDLQRMRDERAVPAALVRMEQLYPFDEQGLKRILAGYQEVDTLVWAQEEPENRGAFRFVAPWFQEFLEGRKFIYAGRPASASPATGSLSRHRQEQQRLLQKALGVEEET